MRAVLETALGVLSARVERDEMMDRWTALSWSLVAGVGTLLFLKVVALQISFMEGGLTRLEVRQKAARKRRRQAARDAEVIEAELAARGDAA